MGISTRFEPAPQASLLAIKDAADHMDESDLPALAATLRATQTSDAARPHGVYSIPVDAARDGTGLEHAVRTGWRYFAPDNRAIEVHDDGSETHRFGDINSGPFAEGMHDALEALSDPSHDAVGEFVVSFLRVRPLNVFALWLRGEDGDQIVPLAPAPAPFEPNALLTPEQFNAALQAVALDVRDNPFATPPR